MTAPVGARAEEAAGRTIRDLVGAWQAQASRCDEAFLSAIAGINRELDAVGGYATTSPEWKDGKGYCRDYWRQGDTFGGGVSVVGEDAGGGHAGKVTPHEPEVGDRCFALEQAWRREATALTDAVYAVRERVASVAGHRGVDVRCGDVEGAAELGLGPEHVALALIMEGL